MFCMVGGSAVQLCIKYGSLIRVDGQEMEECQVDHYRGFRLASSKKMVYWAGLGLTDTSGGAHPVPLLRCVINLG